jgi:hypothetical protein
MFGDDESNILKELSLMECGYRKMSFVVRRVKRKVVGFEGCCCGGGCGWVGCGWVDVVDGCGCGCGFEGWLVVVVVVGLDGG